MRKTPPAPLSSFYDQWCGAVERAELEVIDLVQVKTPVGKAERVGQGHEMACTSRAFSPSSTMDFDRAQVRQDRYVATSDGADGTNRC